MLIFGVILLIFLGLIFLFIELFIIPGISIAGIASIVFIISGISTAFIKLGSQSGIITLLASVFSIILMLYFAFKPKTWNRLSLKEDISSKAGDVDAFKLIKVGDIGRTISRLAPTGEVEINGIIIEATSAEGFINANAAIEVVKNDNYKIIIKLR